MGLAPGAVRICSVLGIGYLSEIRKVTDKPIVAVLYSHAHYSLGSEALLTEQ
jgi:hypothetical protein